LPKIIGSKLRGQIINFTIANVTLLTFQVVFIFGGCPNALQSAQNKLLVIGCLMLNIYSLVAQTFFLFFPLWGGGRGGMWGGMVL
jgi:hypothetical protein